MNEDVVICRCEEVSAGEVRRAIQEGANSLAAIARHTRAGMGLCQGKTCNCLLARLLAAETGITLEEARPRTARPPVRPVPLGAWAPRAEPADRGDA